ncbi:hypothetical protein JoomaDRAFT_1701 [Galbibacter orientalis DSM 19592]|uniref:HTH luxR-type domain-containing protein n=1 Tax=Galbibacter orientalis DSM 19592 TaxID=926559 RepID=I3C517_9FLAO|nr:tetratricopeptide repeat protein [Galbibacter orientalis]EIJ38710.1 hypothetical protein JoomaDRAFT_1701 [Galbibacter orientalis DSM 19592]
MNLYKYFLVFFLCCSCFIQSQEISNDSILSQTVDSVFFKLKKELTQAIDADNDTIVLQKYIEFADFYKKSGAVNEAIVNYQIADTILKDKKDTLRVYLKLQIGAVNFSVKQFEIAKSAYKEALEISEKIDYIKGEALAQSAIGSCFEKQGNYNKALFHQYKSLPLFEKIHDNIGLALVNENIGSIYEDKLAFDKAFNYFQKALDYIVLTDDVDRKINILNNLGDAKRKDGKYEEALIYTLQAKEMAIETSNKHQLESAYKDLSKNYALTNNYEKAYLNLGISDSIRDEILWRQNVQQVNALQALYGAKSKQAKIDLLVKENQVKSAHESLLILVIVVLLVLAVILYFYFKKRKENAIKLQHYKQKALQADLEKKKIIEENLQREIQLKTSSLSKYSLHLAHKNKTLSEVAHTLKNLKGRKQIDIQGKLTEVVEVINEDLSEKQEWEQFMGYFEQIHPSFFKKLEKKSVEELSPSELRLCTLLKLNLSSKEIASILRITPDSIRIARYRLRKKLTIASGDKLTRFLHQL